MNQNTRYIIGIDLGTTNSALNYVDTTLPEAEQRPRTLNIPQIIAPGEVARRAGLPSFIYLPESHELRAGTFALPWSDADPDFCVGAYAREMASKAPGKVASSAKSWLCVETVDRCADILPFDRQPVPRQISPLTAQGFLLAHLREAWNHELAAGNPELRLENQELLLTVPASFDAVARELTVEAAESVGLHPRLLEEPQAAFYAWLYQQEDSWRDQVSEGDVILVCDIGGGTTDFSMIAVNDTSGTLGLQRIAVGEHILLGGDNMDLALAYSMAERIKQEQRTRLDGYQIAGLTHQCREAKEKLGSGRSETGRERLTVLGRGTGIVGGAVSTEITDQDLTALLVDNFFPRCEITEAPAARRRVGLRSFGLEYASDPAVSRHLAAFLNQHSFRDGEGRPILPGAILFNGGITKAENLKKRIIEILEHWNIETGQTTRVLEGTDPDLAVARGAAWYGKVQRTGGVKIKSGSPRTYYVGIEASLPAVPGFAPPIEALCVVNFGMEEGSQADIPSEGLGLIVGEPTEFRFFSSTTRTEDAVGTVLEAREGEEELKELPPLAATLPAEDAENSAVGTLIPVTLETMLTEVGTLQLWCRDTRSDRRWKLEFEIR